MLSRTGSIQSTNSMSSLPRAPTIQNINRSSAAEEGGPPITTSRAAKRMTWTAPSHRAGASSISSFEDIKGRFGGRTTPVHGGGGGGGGGGSRPASPNTSNNTTPTWRQNMISRPESGAPIQNKSHSSPSTYQATTFNSRTYSPSPELRPLSPTTTASNFSAPLESEIMRASFSTGHKPKQMSVHLGAVKDLGSSSVSALRNLRDFAVQDSSNSNHDATVDRTFTVNGGTRSNTHRRSRTLPSLDIEASTPAISGQSIGNGTSRTRPHETDIRLPRSHTGRLNMHGLDRLSERSDGSTSSGPISPHHCTVPKDDGVGLGRPDKNKNSSNRRMASDAGENETGAIVIPGITVGSDSVAGMSGRLRLARQPTQTKFGNLPSQTIKALDTQRQCLQAYEYLCHVSEAKEWLVQCLSAHPMSPTAIGVIQSPDLTSHTFSSPRMAAEGASAGDGQDPSGLSDKSVVELEEALRNGIALARLAKAFVGPKAVPRIFAVGNNKIVSLLQPAT